jgi:hypothetical protein
LTNNLNQSRWIALSESKAGEAHHVTALGATGFTGVNAEALRAQFDRHKGRRTGSRLMGAIGVAGSKTNNDPGIALAVGSRNERMRVWE